VIPELKRKQVYTQAAKNEIKSLQHKVEGLHNYDSSDEENEGTKVKR